MSAHIRIETEREGAIRRITFDRHEKRNAISPPMFDTLIEAFSKAPPPEERVTVIQSEGTVFSAGVDLSERIQNGWPQKSPLVQLCDLIRNYPLPVLGAMQGDAIAGGCMLVLHCDLIVAQEGARLGMPLAQLGIAPPWILTSRTINRVGPALGRELVLMGDPMPVERIGQAVFNAIVPAEEFRATVDRFANQLANNAPLSLRAVKASLATIGSAGDDAEHDYENSLVRAALDSADAREGMKARLEGRAPNFQGV